mmetsp:Transcript_7850/g.33378  ORF Transcript_7850/g.33378 Transcript_7850/m.33378 type:complete len:325 (+) Transcript_7850:294-1268(+)
MDLATPGRSTKSVDMRNSTRHRPGLAGSTACIWWMFQSPGPPSSATRDSSTRVGRKRVSRGSAARSDRSAPAIILGKTSSEISVSMRVKGTFSVGVARPATAINRSMASSASMGNSTVTSAMVVNPSGAASARSSSFRIAARCVSASALHFPVHTRISPSRSTTGAASTKTSGSSFLMEGIFTHSPPVVYSQPWYGHCTFPSTSFPSEMGHARCAHSSFTQPARPCSSRNATQGTLNRSNGIMVPSPRSAANATGNHCSRSAREPIRYFSSSWDGGIAGIDASADAADAGEDRAAVEDDAVDGSPAEVEDGSSSAPPSAETNAT